MVINDGTTFVCQYWMISRLKLKGSSLLVYAFLFSVASEDGKVEISQHCIAEVCGINQSAVSRALFKLENEGFILSKQNNPKANNEIKTYTIKQQECFDDLGIVTLGFDMTNDEQEKQEFREQLNQNKEKVEVKKENSDVEDEDGVEKGLCKFFLDKAKSFSLV